MRFTDRADAGRRLGARLDQLGLLDPVVLGVPRGGVPVAVEAALVLGAPVDVFVARKVGAPGHEELGIGAIAEGSDELVVGEAAAHFAISEEGMRSLAAREHRELARRVARYRTDPLPALRGRDVIVVDDGIATGVTAEAALRALRLQEPRTLILATPVCAAQSVPRLAAVADAVVALHTTSDLGAVGYWYDDFGQTTDEEVLRLLGRG